ATAEKHATEVMVEKLASAMDQQVKAIIEEALAELRERRPVYLNCEPALNPIAQGDRRRVQALYVKMRLKQELPQSFNDIYGTFLNPPGGRFPVYVGSSPGPGWATLPVKDNYRIGLRNAAAGATAPELENAACLYLILSQSRRGVTALSREDLGANSVTEVP